MDKEVHYSKYLEYWIQDIGTERKLNNISLSFEGILQGNEEEIVSNYAWSIHEILNDKSMKERSCFKFVMNYLSEPVGKVQYYLA